MTRFTVRDPRFEVVCTSCRFGEHKCFKRIDVLAGLVAGTYRCACNRCRVVGAPR